MTQSRGPWSTSLEGELVDAKDDVSRMRNEIETGAYALAHLRARDEQPRWSLQFGVKNLLDTFHELPLAGAYVGQGTTMTIPPAPNQPQWGTAVPGPGRSVYLAVSVSL